VLGDELPQAVDDREAAPVALARGLAPGEKAMAAEHDPVAAEVTIDRLAQHQGQLETGALPRDPDQAMSEAPVELLGLGAAVTARGQRNRPIRVEVVDVRKGEKGVQRGVDRGGHPVRSEGGERVVTGHLVLERLAAVEVAKPQQAVHTEESEAVPGDAAQVAAAPLDRKHLDGPCGERVCYLELAARVPAAEIGDAQIGAEE